MRDTITKLLSATGIAAISRAILASEGRFVPMFHGISARRHPDLPRTIQPDITADELRIILAWLEEKYRFLSPDAFFDGEPGVLLTFDDGLASNYTNALPILEEFDAPAIFFVSTQHVIEPTDWLPASRRDALAHWPTTGEVPRAVGVDFWDGMSVEQLRDCASHPLITIGGHTVSHPRLPECESEQVRAELTTSRQWLQDVTGQPINTFAYPYGAYNRQVAEITREVGYQAAFADNAQNVGLPDYEIPRVGIYYADHAYLDVKLSGLYKRPI